MSEIHYDGLGKDSDAFREAVENAAAGLVGADIFPDVGENGLPQDITQQAEMDTKE